MNSEARLQQRGANGDPYNALLKDKQKRTRVLPRDTAHHPVTIRRVLGELDAAGPSAAADVIHSLVWRLVLAENRADFLAKELRDCECSHSAE